MSCNSPVVVKVKDRLVSVPCRRCMGCRIQRRNYLSMLARFEAFSYYQKDLGCTFVTLTYDDDNVPLNGSLDVSDGQKFIKRLREHLARTDFPKKEVYVFGEKREVPDFKYFLSGEYGDDKNTFRPHFHLILFGVSSFIANNFVRKTWKKGIFYISDLNNARIRYCMKYIDKQYNTDNVPDDSFVEPYSVYSKGLGFDFINENFNDILKFGGINNGGKIVPLSPYLRRRYGLDSNYNFLDLTKNDIEQAIKNNMSLSDYRLWCKYEREMSLVHSSRLKSPCDDKSLQVAKYNYLGSMSDFHSEDNINSLVQEVLK